MYKQIPWIFCVTNAFIAKLLLQDLCSLLQFGALKAKLKFNIATNISQIT